MNKKLFESKWKQIRNNSTGWWTLMSEYDLKKVDKADAKLDKYVTMLHIKDYTAKLKQAKAEIDKRVAEFEA